jgi:hypothetical protein
VFTYPILPVELAAEISSFEGEERTPIFPPSDIPYCTHMHRLTGKEYLEILLGKANMPACLQRKSVNEYTTNKL